MTLKLDGELLLLGAGNMGGAMLTGWLAQGLDPKSVLVQDPAPPPAIAALLSKHGIKSAPKIEPARPPAVILAAVKPQIMDEAFPPVAKFAGPDTVVLSIAAGKTIAGFEKHLPKNTAVVRSMPNTPASVARGITAAVGNAHVTAKHKAACQSLLEAVGAVVWLDREDLIDAVTAVSGSGPAYVFLLAECMTEAGRKAGLPAETAAQLARWTVAGAGELLHRSDLGADQLRKNVTSPNGTTYAALQVLMSDKGLQPLMDAAIDAAAKRSKELAS